MQVLRSQNRRRLVGLTGNRACEKKSGQELHVLFAGFLGSPTLDPATSRISSPLK